MPSCGMGLPIPYRAESLRQAVEPQVNHRCRVQREQLAQQQAAHNRDAQRPPQFRTRAAAQSSGNPPSRAAIVVIMIGRKRNRQAW